MVVVEYFVVLAGVGPANVGLDAINPIAIELPVVTGVETASKAIGRLLRVAVVVVAEEVDGLDRVCAADEAAAIETGPVIGRGVIDVTVFDRSWCSQVGCLYDC